jgi:hypothetical protein
MARTFESLGLLPEKVRPVDVPPEAWERHLDGLMDFYSVQEGRLRAAGCDPLLINAVDADAILADPGRAAGIVPVNRFGQQRQAGRESGRGRRRAVRDLILASDPDSAGFVPVRASCRDRLRWVTASGGKWRAMISFDGFSFNGGRGDDPVEVQKSALRAARKYLLGQRRKARAAG